MNETTIKTPSKTGWIMRKLWAAAGGDRYLLEEAPYSDRVKYLCLGGIIVATASMASLAGGYAFYTIFSPKTADVLDKTKTLVQDATYIPTDTTTLVLSIIFGIIWGLIIFNIDRFIVVGTGKGDGSEIITSKEFIGALPRLIMATVIAITISKPLEIRMFKTEIDLAIQREQQKEKERGIDQAKINFNKKSEEAKGKLNKIYQKISENDSLINFLTIEFNNEVRGVGNSNPGYEKRAKAIEKQINQLKAENSQIRSGPEYIENQKELTRIQNEFNIEVKLAEQRAASLDGLLIRIQKSHEIAGMTISLFVTLLFWVIEVTPIFFKLMLIKTPYDYLADNRDDLLLAHRGIYIDKEFLVDSNGARVDKVVNLEADKLIFEKQKVTEIQKELTEFAIGKYKDREKNNIDSNLDEYIKKI